MSATVLVAFVSPYGSTREVADEIAAILREAGFETDLREAQPVVSLKGYDAVVLGAPIYLERLHPEAREFLERHSQSLPGLPVALFALGPVGKDEALIASWQGTLETELARYAWLSPIATAMFGGRYDPARLEEFHREVAELPASPLRGMEATDLRDWDAIRTWADELASMLSPEETTAGA